MKAVKVVSLLALCVLLALGVRAARTLRNELASARPPRIEVQAPGKVLPGLEVHEVHFPTDDGLTLEGWLVPSKNGAAVVLVHGFGANREELAFEARALAAQGFGVLLIDTRGHGRSQGDRTTDGDLERGDVRAAMAVLGLPPARIGLLGFSMGSTAVARAAALKPHPGAVLIGGATTTSRQFCADEAKGWAWFDGPLCVAVLRYDGIDVEGLSVIDRLRELEGTPLFVVHGALDPLSPVVRAHELFEAAGEPKRLLILEGAGHGHYGVSNPVEYAAALTAFFQEFLAPRRD